MSAPSKLAGKSNGPGVQAMEATKRKAAATAIIWQAIGQLTLKEKMEVMDSVMEVVETAFEEVYPEANMGDEGAK